MSRGIDYGLGQTNIDHKTGIRFGVISQNEVLQAWCDSSEPIYISACPYCGEEISKRQESALFNYKNVHCKYCGKSFNNDDLSEQEPIGFKYEQEGYAAQQSFDDPDIFICESPFFTYAEFCSPCAPGACYLLSPFIPDEIQKHNLEQVQALYGSEAYGRLYKEMAEGEGYEKAYCFDASWFENEKAPYVVFEVKTGNIVE